MRCFIAVDLNDDVKEKVINLQKLMPKAARLVGKENLHFTLKFLGEIDEEMVDKTREKLRQIAKITKNFTIKISEIGTFPNDKFIRVVWVGCQNREFADLHNAVDEAMADMLPREKPVPHLTLARVQERSKELSDFITNNRNTEIGEMPVNKIKLKKSALTWKGPVYEDIEVFDLC
ncbi:MAG: RNA 2',3'-cyclic phosphodiesterase [Candidatus Aenigmarchaeota archaeon]|nr:RNA 2',3'-cyclic phosphodiesterase [Candidatus Aenigmarchaeota archaeon]